MSSNLDEDIQGLLKALIVLVTVFGALALVSVVFGPGHVEHLLA